MIRLLTCDHRLITTNGCLVAEIRFFSISSILLQIHFASAKFQAPMFA